MNRPTLPRRLAALCVAGLGATLMLLAGLLPAMSYDDPSLPVRPEARDMRPAGNHLSIARSYIGTNPTGRQSLWCADAANLILEKAGLTGTGSRMARSFLSWGRQVPLSRARPGDVVVLSRGRRGGHVGFLVEREGGRVKLISGNACSPRQVCISSYPVSRVIGVRRPGLDR